MGQAKFWAVIEVGSKHLSLCIWQHTKKGAKRLDLVRESLGLGADCYRQGAVGEDSIRACCHCLQAFRRKLEEYGISVPERVVATSALREAKNREAVCYRIYEQSGFEVEILDASEELGLRMQALWAQLREEQPEAEQKDYAIWDVGAGSLHLSQINAGHLVSGRSEALGALRLSTLYERLKLSSQQPLATLRAAIQNQLAALPQAPGGRVGRELIFLSEEGFYLKRLLGYKKAVAQLSRRDLSQLIDILLHSQEAELAYSYDIDPATCRLLLPTCLIMEAGLQYSGAETCQLPNLDLCAALIYVQGLGRKEEALQRRWLCIDVAWQQARQFGLNSAQLACRLGHIQRLWPKLARGAGLEAQDQLYCELAGLLMSLGLALRSKGYSRLSYDLIRQLELPGISAAAQEEIATIARLATEDSLRYKYLEKLALPRQRSALISALVLRLAAALSSSGQLSAEDLAISRKNDVLQIQLPAGAGCDWERLQALAEARNWRGNLGLSLHLQELSTERRT